MKILICGFSGSGKSTWLSKLEGLKFESFNFHKIDLDHFIENKAGVGEGQLIKYIEKVGEDEFRTFEKNCLLDLLTRPDDLVIALGGGALNLEVLSKIKEDNSHFLIYLEEDFEVCLARIKNDSNRLLSRKSDNDLIQLFQHRRENFYLKADLIITTTEAKKFEDLNDLVHTLRRL